MLRALLLIFLNFSVSLAANGPAELWALSFEKEKPVAVFFDASEKALFVSVDTGSGARLDRVGLNGKLEKAGVAKGKGSAGPLRAYAGHLFWIVGQEVLSYGPDGLTSAGTAPISLGYPVDIALNRSGGIFLGMSRGMLYRITSNEGSRELGGGQAISGLFLLDDTLYILRGTSLQAVKLAASADIESKRIPFCNAPCFALERSSAGNWITTQNGKVLEMSGTTPKILLQAGKEVGRPAYVYRKETKDDFFVVPFPKEGTIRAYRHLP